MDGGVDVDVDQTGPRWTTLDVDAVDKGVDLDVDQTGPRWTTLDVDAVDEGVDDGRC